MRLRRNALGAARETQTIYLGSWSAEMKHLFKKGNVPANKGRPCKRVWERKFKKGQFPHGCDPEFHVIGALCVTPLGYIAMRIGFGRCGWKLLHRILWEDAHGPVPERHRVVFKDGDKLNVCLENLELLSLADIMRRNTIQRYPRSLRDALCLVRKLERKLSEND